MNIKENYSLKTYNTFGIDAKADFFVEINNLLQLQKALQLKNYSEKFVLSGGSNMLITKNLHALVMHINLKGITIFSENQNTVTIKVMAGENWHNLVLWSLNEGYGGIENLSLIPGSTGTAPIQNIGAYGVELKDVFVSCEAIHINTLEHKEFTKEDCKFGYRESIFKNEVKGQYIITAVKLQLTKQNHKLHTHYGAIEEVLKEKKITDPSIKDVSNAVINIRESKLPNPKEIGNSGSFFKNPVVSKKTFTTFRINNPSAPFYEIDKNNFKIPAGWLIEQCGFKGKRYGDAGVHKKQALVLVNYGKASGQEILDLAKKIKEAVFNTFNIIIEFEVNIINNPR